MTTRVREIVPGEYEVRTSPGDASVRVLVPAGVGVPGAGEDELAGAVVEELTARGRSLPATVDVAQLLRSEPGLLEAVEGRLDLD
jgi:hypothetical protein